MMTCHQISRPTFSAALLVLHRKFLQEGHRVHTHTWQGLDILDRPEAEMHELLNVQLHVPLLGVESLAHWAHDVKPNLPWADDHFKERVCGLPINPGEEWKRWPWGLKAQDSLNDDGQFNHNYMERFWPRYAGKDSFDQKLGVLKPGAEPHRGIRHEYGDLVSLIQLMAKDPLTRQAWLPIFFPEDTGVGDGGRKPCTLGYQFMVRDHGLHIYYPLRSCDFYRHFRDDIYLALRLGLWVLDRLREVNPYFNDVVPSSYTMHCTSLHAFINDLDRLKQGA